MAQTEEMKRLLWKGDIAGYEWHKVYHGVMYIRHGDKDFVHSEELHPLVPEEPATGIEHDSFEIGIKVGDEWWFEGDKGKDTLNSNYGKFTLVLEDGFMWLLCLDGDEEAIVRYELKTTLAHAERI